jgi:hypothetical protein
MEIRMRLAIALVVAATGCAAPPGEGVVHTATVQSTVAPKQTMDLTRDVVVRQVTIEAPRARVWEELHAVHRALGLDFVNGDVASGSATFEAANRIRTVAGKPASRYIDCGQGPAGARADSYRLTVRLQHKLENPTAGSTILTSTMQAWARNPGVSSDPIPCASYGLLEREIGGMVMTRLQ